MMYYSKLNKANHGSHIVLVEWNYTDEGPDVVPARHFDRVSERELSLFISQLRSIADVTGRTIHIEIEDLIS